MAQSPEYPDLAWMPPRSWTDANRTSVQLVVIHTTEGSSRGTSAEDGASYDQRRTDGTSTHYFHDNNSTVQCVRTADQAHAARAQGNRRGIQHELCAKAWEADWNDAYHQAMLRLAAKQAARDAKKWAIPARHLTVAQVAAGSPGFCGHADVTAAFPQDKGTHTDPGPNFPWTQFLNLVRAELAPPAPPEDDVFTEADKKWLSAEIGRIVDEKLKAVPEDVFIYSRRSQDAAWSMTGANLFAAEITEAIRNGTAIERYPANVSKGYAAPPPGK